MKYYQKAAQTGMLASHAIHTFCSAHSTLLLAPQDLLESDQHGPTQLEGCKNLQQEKENI